MDWTRPPLVLESETPITMLVQIRDRGDNQIQRNHHKIQIEIPKAELQSSVGDGDYGGGNSGRSSGRGARVHGSRENVKKKRKHSEDANESLEKRLH